jgi:hypothetical protein
VIATRALLLVLVLLAGALGVSQTASAEGEISIEIDKHARLTPDGSVIFTVRVTCGPLAGSEDFREALVGAAQAKTGAGGEGGLSPGIVCDGVERAYTAGVAGHQPDAVFKRGPARAFVGVTACNIVGDDQVCAHALVRHQIVIAGRLAA